MGAAVAQPALQDLPAARDTASARTVTDWLVRLQQASRVPSYAGTFVVTASNGAMSSARIWHASDGHVQLERVETLTGKPRSVFRRNESVVTFLPERGVVLMEQRDAGGLFPNVLTSNNPLAAADYYSARELGVSRVAGAEADIVQLDPRDEWRFGYRIWSERQTGLVLKTQTIDRKGRVLEQAAFSELDLNAPVHVAKLMQLMQRTDGLRVVHSTRVMTSADAEGWTLRSTVPGFTTRNCYRRNAAVNAPVQWVFTDGLATVSLFIEHFDAERHAGEGMTALGATHTLTRMLKDGSGNWWVTAVGEVPATTLSAFVGALERKH